MPGSHKNAVTHRCAVTKSRIFVLIALLVLPKARPYPSFFEVTRSRTSSSLAAPQPHQIPSRRSLSVFFSLLALKHVNVTIIIAKKSSTNAAHKHQIADAK